MTEEEVLLKVRDVARKVRKNPHAFLKLLKENKALEEAFFKAVFATIKRQSVLRNPHIFSMSN